MMVFAHRQLWAFPRYGSEFCSKEVMEVLKLFVEDAGLLATNVDNPIWLEGQLPCAVVTRPSVLIELFDLGA